VKLECDQLFQCTDAHPHTTHVEALPCRRTLLCAQPRISASVFSVVRRASTQRSLRCSACSVLKLERHRGRREPHSGCGQPPRYVTSPPPCRVGTIRDSGSII
jgi:hypothetical protein